MKMDWFIYSIGAMFTLSILFLLVKYINNLGVKSETIVFYQFAIPAIILGIILYFTGSTIKVPNKAFIFLIILGITAVVGNLLLFKAVNIAKNPGYALAIGSLNTLFVLIGSIFLFKAEFDIIKIIGVIFAVIGVVLLSLK